MKKALDTVATILLGIEPVGERYLRGEEIRIRAAQMHAQAEVERLTQISDRALEHIAGDADPTNLDPDWREVFRAKASRVTSGEMQEVWAKVLATEINEGGSFSIQTVNILANMNRSDAQSFASICRFTWRDRFGRSHVVLFEGVGPAFTVLTNQESLGLVAQKGYHRNTVRSETLVFHDETEMRFTSVTGDELHIPMGNVMFARAGKELASIVDLENASRGISYYVPRCVDFWERRGDQGYRVSVVPPKSD